MPDHPVIQLDIQPTALAAAGGSVKKQWRFDGVNRLPDLEDKATGRPREKLFCRLGPHWAIRQDDWKRMKAPEEKMLPTTALPKMPVGPVHLYNPATDITESTDLSTKLTEKVIELKVAREARNKGLTPSAWLPSRPANGRKKKR